MTAVTPALLDYYRGWIGGVLRDGHYKPGIYAAKSNVSTLYDAAVAAFHAAGTGDTPRFWVAAQRLLDRRRAERCGFRLR